MRLLPETDGQPMPFTVQGEAPLLQRLSQRGWGLVSSPQGITALLGVLLSLSLMGLISLGYLDISHNVDRNNISLSDFYAEYKMEVVDTDATQRKIDRTRQSLTPIYQDETPHNQDILRDLTKTLDHLSPIVLSSPAPSEDKHSRFMQEVGDTSNAEVIYEHYLSRTIPTTDWARIRQIAQVAMQDILKNGFSEADDQLKRQTAIEAGIPETHLSPGYHKLIYFLVDNSLQPNRIVDENAMRAKQDAVTLQINGSPETKTYIAGQKIIGKGEPVTPVAKSALQRLGKTAGSNVIIPMLGVFLMCILFTSTLWRFLYRFQEHQYYKPSYASLLAFLVVSTFLLMQVQLQSGVENIPFYLFPLATFSLILAIFTHPFVSVFATTLIVFLAALCLRTDFSNLSILLFGSYVGIYTLSHRINRYDRGQLMVAGLYVGMTNALIVLGISLLHPSLGAAATTPNAPSPGLLNIGLLGATTLLWPFLSGLFSGIITIGCLPLLETVFRLVTPYTLLELGNHDQPLLKRMQFEAPGTFHHSLMVATLAETAAEAIGANALLTRVGCLYHDIGKMKRPLFFIENQAYFGVENPHDKLTPRLSKMVITAHPRDSLEMARQHKLPECLMKFMTEHHGTLTAGYFYTKACSEEGPENVNKSQFRYPGPKPGSKETVIVMLADACESAVRALKNPTVAQVEERIDKIIFQRIEDGQFEECPITFKDINIIKQTFVRVLRGIQHNRIEYQQNMMRELGRKLPSSVQAEAATLVSLVGCEAASPSEQEIDKVLNGLPSEVADTLARIDSRKNVDAVSESPSSENSRHA